MRNKNQVYGSAGEAQAVLFLKKKKYKILETNFQTPFGELDIIAKQKNTYVFVEVKTRASKEFGDPSQAVNFAKRNHIKNSANYYLDRNYLFDEDIRFDIIEVIGEKTDFEVNHIEDAFC